MVVSATHFRLLPRQFLQLRSWADVRDDVVIDENARRNDASVEREGMIVFYYYAIRMVFTEML